MIFRIWSRVRTSRVRSSEEEEEEGEEEAWPLRSSGRQKSGGRATCYRRWSTGSVECERQGDFSSVALSGSCRVRPCPPSPQRLFWRYFDIT